MGSAFLYARSEQQHLTEPLIVGHGWFPDKASEMLWPAIRERCHQMAVYGLPINTNNKKPLTNGSAVFYLTLDIEPHSPIEG